MAIILKSTSAWLDKYKKRADIYIDVTNIILLTFGAIFLGFYLVNWNNKLLILIAILIFLLTTVIFVKLVFILGKNIRNHTIGYNAEIEILERLEQLPNNYYISRDPIVTNNGNIDFVVIGPNGIFAIEVKGHAFKIGISENQLTYSNKTNYKGKNFIKQAKSGALKISNHFKSCGMSYYVQPILTFTSARGLRLGKKKLDNTYIVRKEWLNEIILENKGFVDKNQFGKLLICLEH